MQKVSTVPPLPLPLGPLWTLQRLCLAAPQLCCWTTMLLPA